MYYTDYTPETKFFQSAELDFIKEAKDGSILFFFKNGATFRINTNLEPKINTYTSRTREYLLKEVGL